MGPRHHIHSKSNRRGYDRASHPLEVARRRVAKAKSSWTDATVAVMQRTPGAVDRIAPALEELHAAFADFDAQLATIGECA